MTGQGAYELLTPQECPARNPKHPQWFMETPDLIKCPWCERDRARDLAAALEAQNAAALALHKPQVVMPSGGRYEHTVRVECGEGVCDGTYEQPCAESDDGEHELPACWECRQVTEDGDAASPLWPCPTARALGVEPNA